MLRARPVALRSRARTTGSTVLVAALMAALAPAAGVHAAKPRPSAKPGQVAVSTKTVTQGTKVRLSGRTSPRTKVKVQARLTTTEYAIPRGGNVHDEVKHRWKTIRTVRTNKRGRWKLSHKPQAPLVYRARTSRGKSRTTPVAVWRWSDLKHRSRGGILKTQSGGLGIVDTVVGGTAHIDALRSTAYTTPAIGNGTWDLGGRCTALRAAAAIPDTETSRQDHVARVQVLIDGRPAVVSTAGYGRTTPVTADLTGAPAMTLQVDDTTGPRGLYDVVSYDVVLVDAQVYCKD